MPKLHISHQRVCNIIQTCDRRLFKLDKVAMLNKRKKKKSRHPTSSIYRHPINSRHLRNLLLEKYRSISRSWSNGTSIHCDARHLKGFQSDGFCIFLERKKGGRQSHAKSRIINKVRPCVHFTFLPLSFISFDFDPSRFAWLMLICATCQE